MALQPTPGSTAVQSLPSPQPPPQRSGFTLKALDLARGAIRTTVNATYKASNYVSRIPERLATQASEGALGGVSNKLNDPSGPLNVLRHQLNSYVAPH